MGGWGKYARLLPCQGENEGGKRVLHAHGLLRKERRMDEKCAINGWVELLTPCVREVKGGILVKKTRDVKACLSEIDPKEAS